MIAAKLREFLEKGSELILTTGGMSVDPDDVTRSGVQMAGVEDIYYGAAVLPGAMLAAGLSKGEGAHCGHPGLRPASQGHRLRPGPAPHPWPANAWTGGIWLPWPWAACA